MGQYFTGFKGVLAGALIVLSMAAAAEQSAMTETGDGAASYSLALSVEQEQQRFESETTDITTVSFDPAAHWGDWSLMADLPWQSISGEQFVVGGQVSESALCQQLNQLSVLQLQRLSQRRSNIATLAANCAAQSANTETSQTVSGFGDLAIYLSTGKILGDNQVWYGQLTAGYKHDNGDVDKGLGSGTQELLFDISLNAQTGRWRATWVAGYTAIIGGESHEYYDNYPYVSADVNAELASWLRLGVSASWEQASTEWSDDVSSMTAYARVSINEQWGVQLRLIDYLDTVGYPEQAVSAALSFYY